MKKISFEEIGAVTATFYAADGVKGGHVVGMTGQETVGNCAAGKYFCGVALAPTRGGTAAVQVGGFATLAVSGVAVAPGWVELTADGMGGVKKAAAGDESRVYLVVSMDTSATAVVCL